MTTDLLHTFAIFLGLAKWFGTCLVQLSRAFGGVEKYSYETNYHSKLECHDEKTSFRSNLKNEGLHDSCLNKRCFESDFLLTMPFMNFKKYLVHSTYPYCLI